MTDHYVMATRATHQLGDLSRDVPDLACIYGEDGDDWIGAWVTGMGFTNVRFPRAACRELTAEERQRYARLYVETAGRVTPIGVAADEETTDDHGRRDFRA